MLIEPLSVVEKAVDLAFHLHRGGAEQALVIGAGTIGLPAAMALRARGLAVTVQSIESAGSVRARLVEDSGAVYTAGLPGVRRIL